MVRFQCDGKRKKNGTFLDFCGSVYFFSKNCGARYLIGKYR